MGIICFAFMKRTASSVLFSLWITKRPAIILTIVADGVRRRMSLDVVSRRPDRYMSSLVYTILRGLYVYSFLFFPLLLNHHRYNYREQSLTARPLQFSLPDKHCPPYRTPNRIIPSLRRISGNPSVSKARFMSFLGLFGGVRKLP